MTLDHLEVGLPHVRTHEFDLLTQFLSDHGKELRKAFLRTLLSDPEQSRAPGLDLVDKREVFVSFPILDLIDAKGADRSEFPVIQSPLDDPFHGIEDFLPAGSEAQCGFFPGELASPLRQEDHVRAGERVLAVGPWQSLDLYATGATIDAPHGIEQKHGKAPNGNKLEAALRERIVARRRLVTA
ncbi:hypothetical protein AWB81_08603 [Caballeronia arationis]|nr:hypothetical protein AWB81_08603 [Caballeronia arationis]